MEMTDRKKQILKIVTEGYIQSAEPIGSKTVVERMPGKISSATVRNELADLEEMGYLEQPHTSAGRIPSAKGYRLYVNELMEHKTVTSEEAEKITSAIRKHFDGEGFRLKESGLLMLFQSLVVASSPSMESADHHKRYMQLITRIYY